jgi:hypothetical protein
MKRAASIILLAVCVVAIIGFIVIKAVRRDALPTQINTTFYQLREVSARIEQAFFDARPKTISLAEAKQSVLRENGASYLHSEVDVKKELLINPSINNWINEVSSSETAIVSPVPFPSPDGRNYYMGVTFSLEQTNLYTLPNW